MYIHDRPNISFKLIYKLKISKCGLEVNLIVSYQQTNVLKQGTELM